MSNGACLCGAVRFSGGEVAPRSVSVCHCEFCRKWNGGPSMSVHLAGGVTVAPGAPLVWYRSSAHAERGFCSRCGTSLFWRMAGEPADFAVNAHALDSLDGLQIAAHIWVDEKPGFYEFADSTPRLTAADWMARHATEGGKT